MCGVGLEKVGAFVEYGGILEGEIGVEKVSFRVIVGGRF